MLRTVIDHCLSLASPISPRDPSGTGPSRGVGSTAQTPLGRYPRLQAALEKAEADGVLPLHRSRIAGRR